VCVCCVQQYGVRPSQEELAATGGSCPICQDDLTEPIALHCKVVVACSSVAFSSNTCLFMCSTYFVRLVFPCGLTEKGRVLCVELQLQ
jgi:hypothetical protein